MSTEIKNEEKNKHREWEVDLSCLTQRPEEKHYCYGPIRIISWCPRPKVQCFDLCAKSNNVTFYDCAGEAIQQVMLGQAFYFLAPKDCPIGNVELCVKEHPHCKCKCECE